MIIDFHCHIWPQDASTEAAIAKAANSLSKVGSVKGIRVNPEKLVSVMTPLVEDFSAAKFVDGMDRDNIDVSVCFFSDNASRITDDAALAQNRNVAELAENFPDRIVPFASIDPRRNGASQLLLKCLEEFKMRGLKWHPDVGFDPTSKEAYQVLEIAQNYNAILLTHTGPLPSPRRNRFAHPLLLDDLSCDFPQLKIVAAHSGGMWWRDWCSVSALNENLYGDLAEWQLDAFSDYAKFCRQFRRLLDAVGPGSFLFASDWPAFEAFGSRGDWVNIIRQLPQNSPTDIDFSPEEIEAVLGGNAQNILGL